MILNINDEQGIEFLHWIFERELKPPFRRHADTDEDGDYRYYNRNNEIIGFLTPDYSFSMMIQFSLGIKFKVRKAFESSRDINKWRNFLKSWMENQINVRLNDIY